MHPTLVAWGYDPALAHSFSSLSRPELTPARVVSDVGSQLEVIDPDGAPRPAVVAGRLRHEGATVVTGDWVALDPAPTTAVVHHVLPRRTQLVRRAAGRAEAVQVVAANVDLLAIVTSANRDANPRRLERYLAAAWDSGAEPLVLVNKRDLLGPAELDALVAALAAAAPGVAVLALSAHTGDGLDALIARLAPGRTLALVGTSGVGKSSVVNRLLGEAVQVTLPIDEVARGRHATSRRALFRLPGGALVLDTPGMRSFGLIDSGDGLAAAFADVTELAGSCRFRDCRHDGEPGCAVARAIDDGALDPRRRDGLHKLEREVAASEARHDPALAQERRARAKELGRAVRAHQRLTDKLRR